MDDEHERRSGWAEYQQLVLSELKYLRSGLDQVHGKIDDMKDGHTDDLVKVAKETEESLTGLKIEIAILKTKAALYGSCAGFIVGLILHYWK